MSLIKKILLGSGALALIFVGGSGAQSNNMLIQAGSVVGLIVALIILYVFAKMAWRAMGCLPSLLLVLAIIIFILYAIGSVSYQSSPAPKKSGSLELLDDKPKLSENFSSATPAEESPYVEDDVEQEVPQSAFGSLMDSITGKKSSQAKFNPASYPPVYGTVRVISGDTLKIQGRFIRLLGVDAPEINQSCADRMGRSYPCGKQAADWLKSWLNDNMVECRIMQQDKKGNMVGTCALGEYDIGAALVNAGWAVVYEKDTDVYMPYQEQAQMNKYGLWQGKFYMPWDWRKIQSQKPNIKIIDAPKEKKKTILDN